MFHLIKPAARRLACLVLIFSLVLPACAISQSSLDQAIDRTTDYLLRVLPAPQVGAVGGEWAVTALARSGAQVPQTYWTDYFSVLEDYVTQRSGVLHARKNTEYARMVIALTAIGMDPSNVVGYDLLVPLTDFDQTMWQGINGPIWALIALDCGRYCPDQSPRQQYVDAIVSAQLPDGGWALAGSRADPDLTAMALQALAPYREQVPVGAAIDRGLNCLSLQQSGEGRFGGTLESTAQAAIALCQLEIGLEDARFVKNGRTILDALLSFQLEDGSFAHLPGGPANQMATEQALCALVALRRAASGQSGFYSMAAQPTVQTQLAVLLPSLWTMCALLPLTAPFAAPACMLGGAAQ